MTQDQKLQELEKAQNIQSAANTLFWATHDYLIATEGLSLSDLKKHPDYIAAHEKAMAADSAAYEAFKAIGQEQD